MNDLQIEDALTQLVLYRVLERGRGDGVRIRQSSAQVAAEEPAPLEPYEPTEAEHRGGVRREEQMITQVSHPEPFVFEHSTRSALPTRVSYGMFICMKVAFLISTQFRGHSVLTSRSPLPPRRPRGRRASWPTWKAS